MKTNLTTLHNENGTFEMIEPVAGKRPVLAPLKLLLLWATVLILPPFGVQAAAVLTTLDSFGTIQDTNGNSIDGSYPSAALVQGSNGYPYGTTGYGGPYGYADYGPSGYGSVFKISTNGTLTTLYSFGSVQDTNGNALDGELPTALVQGRDGNFYGTTSGGGTHGYAEYGSDYGGTVFKISTNGTLTTLYSFGSVQDANGNALDGELPTALVHSGVS